MKVDVAKEIQWFGDNAMMSDVVFGMKAANLDRLSDLNIAIPKGFALSADAVSSIAKKTASAPLIASLRSNFDKLRQISSFHEFIVRSSSQVEDRAEHQLFGLFESIPGIVDFDVLLTEICHIHSTGYSKLVQEYAAKSALSLPSVHLAVIVQEYIPFDYSAVAVIEDDVCMIEAYRGELGRPISGDASPTVIRALFGSTDQAIQTIVSSNLQQLSEEIVQELSTKIVQLAINLLLRWDTPFMLEIGMRAGNLFTLQIRPLSDTQHFAANTYDALLHKNRFPFLQNVKNVGLKAAAMGFFKSKGLFKLPLFISRSPFDSESEKIFTGPEWADGPFTIRFSHNAEIGLPRIFVNNSQEILPAIRRHIKPKWTVIVHKYFEVKRSFELLLIGDMFLLEHVPGMWESENRLPPDVLHVRNCTQKAWLWRNHRTATIAHIGQPDTVDCEPVSRNTAADWLQRLAPIVASLASDAREHDPFNIHFVEDFSGNWQFLNIRRANKVAEPTPVTLPIHIVSTTEDLKRWNGKSSILLKVWTSRGREADLLQLIDYIPRGKPDVFVDCGLLSHPAMVLRENGINVVPAYWAHPPIEGLDNYEEITLNVDIGSDPIERILNENPVFRNSEFTVVHDREPIVENHLLVVSCKDVPSFADLPTYGSVAALLELKIFKEIYDDKPFFFVERGRAQFCTSGFTNNHAHGHIFPLSSFNAGTIDELVNATNATEFSSLKSALFASKESSSEYLLFGASEHAFFLALPSPVDVQQKRFLRTFLVNRIKT